MAARGKSLSMIGDLLRAGASGKKMGISKMLTTSVSSLLTDTIEYEKEREPFQSTEIDLDKVIVLDPANEVGLGTMPATGKKIVKRKIDKKAASVAEASDEKKSKKTKSRRRVEEGKIAKKKKKKRAVSSKVNASSQYKL